ncbi:MAG: UDP-N-acetylmuramoyl-L-alanine--D-glutamate ligase [Planctomycetia bacterium]|jgi:UDP-N-acetylmuramoylalanine--D-glutamate ligase
MPFPITNWNGRRVTVMGLGRFGGGVGVVRWLAGQGARITLTDQASPNELAKPLAGLRDLEGKIAHPIKLHLGGHDSSDFVDTEALIVNPAVRPDNRWVREAIDRKVPITTEIGLFLDACPAAVVGVTGSNGKSTTAAMLASILRADGKKTWLGGNLGGSLLGELASITENDYVVLELSSFQIHYLPENIRPLQIVVVTNCVPNHLDWHDTFEEYAATKRRLIQLQTPDGIVVLSPTLAELDQWKEVAQGRLVSVGKGDWLVLDGEAESLDIQKVPVPFSGASKKKEKKKEATEREEADSLCSTGEKKGTGTFCSKRSQSPFSLPPLPVPGEHNRQNARAASTAARAAGCSDTAIQRGLMTYLGLPDRLEPVGICHGRRCVNDTASTTPESTAAATAALPDSWLLVGGGEKGADFSAMLDELARSAQGVAFYGTVGPKLYEQFKRVVAENDSRSPRFELFTTLDEAFRWSLSQSEPGESIILSPGCSSHDQFTHFVERGEHFKRLVQEA